MKARGRIYQPHRGRSGWGKVKERVADLHAQGLSTKRIAHLTDLSYHSVRNCLLRVGLKPIRHSQWLKSQDIWKK